MFTVQKTLVHATSVTHATLCYFSSSSELDLILIRGHSYLQLWRLQPAPDRSLPSLSNPSSPSSTYFSFTTTSSMDFTSPPPLTLFAEWPLYGHVISVGHVALPCFHSSSTSQDNPDPRECLILTFNEAKAVILQFDSQLRSLRTISLHSFEQLEWLQPTTKTPYPPLLRIEPSHKCALIQIYQDQWAILPFRQHEIDSDTYMTPPTESDPLQKDLPSSTEQENIKSSHPSLLPPYLPSFVIKTNELQPSGLTGIRDVQFVTGYLDPTFAVLYEPFPTWVGLLDSRKDTMRCTFLSLDLHHKHHPTLFTSCALPSSCYQMVPVPQPLGGLLVVSNNALIYLNQVCPNGISISVNAYHALESNYSVTSSCSELGLHLDQAVVSFLHPHVCLILVSTYDLWKVELLSESHVRGVANFQFTKLAHTAPFSHLVTWPSYVQRTKILKSGKRVLENDQALVFMASATGPSLLMYLHRQEQCLSYASPTNTLIDIGDCVHGLTVLDALPSTGNLKDGFIFEMMGRKALFTLGGHELGGHVTLFQQSIHPISVKRCKIGGARRIWAVKTDDLFDSLLVLSGDHQTIVFNTVGELSQLKDTDFVLHQKTVFIGQLCPKCVIQVLERTVLLLNHHHRKLHELPLPSTALMATISLKHIAILLEGNVAQVYRVSTSTFSTPTLECIYTEDQVYWIQLFHDTQGLFRSGQDLYQEQLQASNELHQHRHKVQSNEKQRNGMDRLDDLDIDFYGDEENGDDNDPKEEEVANQRKGTKKEPESCPLHMHVNSSSNSTLSSLSTSSSDPVSPDHLTSKGLFTKTSVSSESICSLISLHKTVLVSLKSSHQIQITQLPSTDSDFKVFFTCCNTAELPDVLKNNDPSSSSVFDEKNTSILQIHLLSFGPRIENSYLLLVTSDANLVFYRAYHPDPPIHFSDTLAGVIFVRAKLDPQLLLSNSPSISGSSVCVHPFKNIHHQSGVFIMRGNQPAVWVLGSRRGALNAYTMDLTDQRHPKSLSIHSHVHATAFAPFHHPICPLGFLFVTSQNYLVFSKLDELLNYDLGLPYRSIPTYRTSHMACYQPETSTCALVSSHLTDFELVIEVPDQLEHNAPSGMKVSFVSPEMLEQRYLPPGSYAPQTREFQLDLISTLNLAIADSYFFDPYEHVVAVVTATLECKQAALGKKPFLVVGTSFVKGEDVATRGKLYVFDVIAVVPEPGRLETSRKFKLLAVEDVKAPVTALAAFHTHLLVGTGAKIIMYDFEDMERLIGVAFHDTQFFVHQLTTFKAFILAGDFYKSVMLLAWQEDPPKLVLVSKDHHPLSTTAVSLLVQGELAGFLAGDEEGGLNVLMYSPYHIQSYGGTKLLRWGDLYLGSVVTKLLHYRMRTHGSSALPEPSFGCFYLCRDGSIGVVAPVSEVMYKRFLLMYNQLSSCLPQTAALHPKAFRRTLSNHRLYSNKQMTLLDLNLITDFLNLPYQEQQKQVTAVGTSLARVQMDLKLLTYAWTIL